MIKPAFVADKFFYLTKFIFPGSDSDDVVAFSSTTLSSRNIWNMNDARLNGFENHTLCFEAIGFCLSGLPPDKHQ
jgi:hypothetical protein